MSEDKKDWFTNGWCSPYWKAFKRAKEDEEKKEYEHFFIWYENPNGPHYSVCRNCGISYDQGGNLLKEANWWSKDNCYKLKNP